MGLYSYYVADKGITTVLYNCENDSLPSTYLDDSSGNGRHIAFSSAYIVKTNENEIYFNNLRASIRGRSRTSYPNVRAENSKLFDPSKPCCLSTIFRFSHSRSPYNDPYASQVGNFFFLSPGVNAGYGLRVRIMSYDSGNSTFSVSAGIAWSTLRVQCVYTQPIVLNPFIPTWLYAEWRPMSEGDSFAHARIYAVNIVNTSYHGSASLNHYEEVSCPISLYSSGDSIIGMHLHVRYSTDSPNFFIDEFFVEQRHWTEKQRYDYYNMLRGRLAPTISTF